MKNIFFRLTLLSLAALTITLYSCQQEDIFEDVQTEVLQDTDTDLRGPLILANVNSGTCCSYKTRKVNITLDNTTYNVYCANGGTLTYKFYRNNAPNASPIVRTSNSATPSFCLSPKSYTVLISDNGVPTLGYSGGSFYINSPVGGSTSPIYTVSLAGCNIAPPPTVSNPVKW